MQYLHVIYVYKRRRTFILHFLWAECKCFKVVWSVLRADQVGPVLCPAEPRGGPQGSGWGRRPPDPPSVNPPANGCTTRRFQTTVAGRTGSAVTASCPGLRNLFETPFSLRWSCWWMLGIFPQIALLQLEASEHLTDKTTDQPTDRRTDRVIDKLNFQ